MDFTNKVVWITGASSGIGEAMAKAFNKAGAKVVLSARNKQELERVQATFARPSESLVLPLDLADSNNFSAATEQVLSAFGQIDIMVHNAGISQRAFAMETSLEDERRLLEVNLFGTLALNKCVLPHLLKHPDTQIVLITSVMGKIGTKYRSAYAAAKHGLIGYFDCLRLELDDKVAVTNIMPGFVNTNIVRNAVSNTFNPNNENKNGMSPDVFVEKALSAIASRKREVYIGGLKEGFALWAKRFMPWLFHRLIKNAKVV
jgi:dehydrogenase/reductase SDR family member 7B